MHTICHTGEKINDIHHTSEKYMHTIGHTSEKLNKMNHTGEKKTFSLFIQVTNHEIIKGILHTINIEVTRKSNK